MAARHDMAMVMTLAALLAGCETVPPQTPAAELTSLKTAADCSSALPTFGRFLYPGQSPRDAEYIPPNGSMVLRNDGGWCVIRNVSTFNGSVGVPDMGLETPPQHGEVKLGHVGSTLWIAYRPLPGFSGGDSFVVRQLSPQPWDVPVRVIVAGRPA